MNPDAEARLPVASVIGMDWRPGHLLRAALLLAALAVGTSTVRVVEAAPAPTVTAVAPVSGPLVGGTAITITGTGFAAGATVDLGGSAATAVVVVSATSITATAAAHAQGAVVVTVTNTDGQGGTLSGGFTYLGPPPTLTAVAPAIGPSAGATTITLTGTEFGAGTTVTVGGVAATNVSAASSTTLTAAAPAGTAGVVNVVVTKADGQSATLVGGYTYTQSPPPAVTSISPTSGTHGGGGPVTITGTGFVAGATVKFGTTAATSVVISSSTSITAVAPAGTANALVNIVVTNADSQTGTLAGAYRFVDTGTVTVTGILPIAGPLAGGTTVTITGTSFNAGATVKFGEVAGTVTSVTANAITAVTPAKTASGKVTVTVTNTDTKAGTLSSGFTYQVAPTLAAVTTPTRVSTAGGTSVSLTGTGFIEGMTVIVGTSAATNVVLAGATKVTFTTPAQPAGTPTVVVRNADYQVAAITNAVLYVAPPTILAVAPLFGDEAGGTEVSIVGEGFAAGASVTFGGKAGTAVAFPEPGRLTVRAPAGAPGTVEVVVTIDGLTASKADGFIYTSTKGKVVGAISAKGISLAMFGGGTTQALVTSTTAAGCPATALAMWVIDTGKFIGYISGAPAIVNADWTKKFTTSIPANTPVIVRCG